MVYTVHRAIAGISKTFVIPDYEHELKEILEETNIPVWVHGIRLPIEEDLLRTQEIVSD